MGLQVPGGSHALDAGRWIAGLSLAGLCASGVAADGPDPAAALDSAISAAEARLQAGDLEGAEGLYREALFEGWLLTATLERLERRLPQARDAVRNASLFRVESRQGLQGLAAAQLRVGETAHAVETLEALAARDAGDGEARRLLARALAADGRMEAAAQRLAEAATLAANDAELAFLVGIDYLWLKKVGEAERLFAQVSRARPIPQTRVLIGRAYRDTGEYDRARSELQAALRQDPSARRAHYYLGMVLLADARTGPDRLERAMAEFREELKLAPDDPAANDQLGLALLEDGRAALALPALENAVRAQARPLYLFHLGRCLLALGRDAEAATALRRALERAEERGGSEAEIGKIHYQLGLALRKLGASAEAATHLAEAGRLAAADRGSDDPAGAASPAARAASDDEASPLSELPPWRRQGLQRRATAGLARAYFNLGVLQAQGHRSAPAAERFARAAAFFERAAELDAGFPQVQASLGVAYFNAREFAKATGPLARAVASKPEDRGLKRMLATSWLNTEAWDKAAALLEDDPERETDASLQFAYGLALLRSGRADRAEEVLTRASAARGDSTELLVLLGQAHAAQGEDEAAIRVLEKALALDASVAEAHGTLGAVYLRQGRLDEAEGALRAELESHPTDPAAQRNLAAVLEARRARGTSRKK
jgi:tetratricopeptide (TPR) repeat protein